MALTLTKSNILTGNVVQASDVSQSIDAFTGTAAYDITLSGSLILTGSVSISGLSQQAYNRVLVIDSSTGNIAYTASSALSGSGGGVTINNNTDNNLLTATGTANTINGESALTYDGNLLQALSSNARAYIYGTTYSDSVYLNPAANAEVVTSFASTANGKGMKLSASPTRSMLLFDSSSNFQISTVPLSTINASPVANTYTGEQIAFTIFSSSRNVQIGTGSVDTGYKLNVSGSVNVSSSLTVTGSVRITGSTTTAPGTTGYVLPSNAYGVNSSVILGVPSAWLSIEVDGATYKLPLYN
jgi:hypothetical protein